MEFPLIHFNVLIVQCRHFRKIFRRSERLREFWNFLKYKGQGLSDDKNCFEVLSGLQQRLGLITKQTNSRYVLKRSFKTSDKGHIYS